MGWGRRVGLVEGIEGRFAGVGAEGLVVEVSGKVEGDGARGHDRKYVKPQRQQQGRRARIPRVAGHCADCGCQFIARRAPAAPT